jgi:tetraacyldisaccharide 4'-kinase
LDQNRYRRLISQESGGFGAKICRAFLKLASYPYSAVITFRNQLYDNGYLQSHRAPVPVISVGNITAGGTGKTPLTIWLCNKLAEKNLKVAVLTRGYKTQATKPNDEPAVIANNCPGTRVIINPDRVAGAVTAIRENGAKVLVMDDGFSHRRLRRDLDIVAIDATCPFGFGRILPAGLLREPLTSLRRAHIAVLTRCDLVPERETARIESRALSINPKLTLARTVHLPLSVKAANMNDVPLSELANRKVLAFCGIGNPDAFLGQLQKLRISLVGSRTYNDHHQYTSDDIADIYEQARYLNAELVLTTEKDWVKAAPLVLTDEIPFAYLAVKLEFLSQEDTIIAIIDKKLKET